MGKYMRRTNSKTSTKTSPIELPSLTGVLTRAKTLALQNAVVSGSGSYIQLRSRRLVKPNLTKKHKERFAANPSKLRVVNSSNLKVETEELGGEDGVFKESGGLEGGNLVIKDEEGSIGENILESEGRGRTTRETTPCSLIRDPDAIKIPSSSTKSTRPTETKYRVQDTTPRQIPLTSEMEEFFTSPEKQQQQLFIEKYNFDPVNDKPLPGRYEWVKLDAAKKS